MAKLNKSYSFKSICYVTKKADTSVAMLDSPEDEVILDALMYLSKFADGQIKNLKCLHQCGSVQKLLNLLYKNICILRLTLRLLGVLLKIKEVFAEIDQEIYDDKILKISDMYKRHNDPIVKQQCASILSTLAKSDRIVYLIFNMDLFYPLLDTIKKTIDLVLLEGMLELFLKLLDIPAALDVLPEINGIDISILLDHLECYEKKVVHLVFKIILELTYYSLDVFQAMFRNAHLVESMLEVVMDCSKQEYHENALDIIINSMKSDETINYFIESLEFLKFCQWVKTCDKKYHLSCILILEKLTRASSKKQILFDLSVENSILSFFRSNEKKILNKTCEAISNMATHKYCFKEMLKPSVLKELFHILLRKDQEDPSNEVALKTILSFSRKSLDTLDLIYKFGAHKVLFAYFKRDDHFISEESYLGVLEILYRMSIHPLHQQDIVSASFFEKLLNLFQTAPIKLATFSSEIITSLVVSAEFRRIFLSLNGPEIFIKELRSSRDLQLVKNVLFFVHSSLIYKDMIQKFLRNGLVIVLNKFSEVLKLIMPITDTILKLVYNQYLPLKFFYTNKLGITDKLDDKFYLIEGQWKADFPFPEELEKLTLSSSFTIYIVDYSFKLKYEDKYSGISSRSERSLSTLTEMSCSMSSYYKCHSSQINYGKLSSDPFLPMYLDYITKYLEQAETVENKIKTLATYIDVLFRRPEEEYTSIDKIHNLNLHVEFLKHKLGSPLIPVGFLRLGGHCERALLFKALADKCCIPATLVKGQSRLYWNEVILFNTQASSSTDTLKMYVVDLMYNIGNLLVIRSRDANQYCNTRITKIS